MEANGCCCGHCKARGRGQCAREKQAAIHVLLEKVGREREGQLSMPVQAIGVRMAMRQVVRMHQVEYQGMERREVGA